jgi:acyl carrier protein
MKKVQKDWVDKEDKNESFKKKILSVKSITITIEEKKDDEWYLDSAAIVHLTHDFSLFISFDLNDDDIETIETISYEKIKT